MARSCQANRHPCLNSRCEAASVGRYDLRSGLLALVGERARLSLDAICLKARATSNRDARGHRFHPGPRANTWIELGCCGPYKRGRLVERRDALGHRHEIGFLPPAVVTRATKSRLVPAWPVLVTRRHRIACANGKAAVVQQAVSAETATNICSASTPCGPDLA